MTPQNEVPQYRLLEAAFIAPDLVPAGSIIETDHDPSVSWEPWNAAALARMEAWLTQEVDEIDPKTKQPTGQKIRPNEKHRKFTPLAGAAHTSRVVAGPEPENANGTSLAMINIRAATDPRPAAGKQFSNESPVKAAADAAAAKARGLPEPAPVIIDPPVAKIISAAPDPSPVTGGIK